MVIEDFSTVYSPKILSRAKMKALGNDLEKSLYLGACEFISVQARARVGSSHRSV